MDKFTLTSSGLLKAFILSPGGAQLVQTARRALGDREKESLLIQEAEEAFGRVFGPIDTMPQEAGQPQRRGALCVSSVLARAGPFRP